MSIISSSHTNKVCTFRWWPSLHAVPKMINNKFKYLCAPASLKTQKPSIAAELSHVGKTRFELATP